MASIVCIHCQAVVAPEMETCSKCGELTPLGLEKERRQRRRGERSHIWRPAFGNPSISLAAVVFGLLLLIFAILAFAYVVDAGLI